MEATSKMDMMLYFIFDAKKYLFLLLLAKTDAPACVMQIDGRPDDALTHRLKRTQGKA